MVFIGIGGVRLLGIQSCGGDTVIVRMDRILFKVGRNYGFLIFFRFVFLLVFFIGEIYLDLEGKVFLVLWCFEKMSEQGEVRMDLRVDRQWIS